MTDNLMDPNLKGKMRFVDTELYRRIYARAALMQHGYKQRCPVGKNVGSQ